MLELLVLLLLILANGVFVLAETALLSARKSRLKQWEDEGRADARAALAFAREPGRFLSTTTIGITVIAILSGAFGEATFAEQLERRWSEITWLQPYAHTAALVTVVVCITVMSVLFDSKAPSRAQSRAGRHRRDAADAIDGPDCAPGRAWLDADVRHDPAPAWRGRPSRFTCRIR